MSEVVGYFFWQKINGLYFPQRIIPETRAMLLDKTSDGHQGREDNRASDFFPLTNIEMKLPLDKLAAKYPRPLEQTK